MDKTLLAGLFILAVTYVLAVMMETFGMPWRTSVLCGCIFGGVLTIASFFYLLKDL